MKKLKATFEAPITFTYEVELTEDDIFCPIDEYAEKLKSEQGLMDAADSIYQLNKSGLLFTLMEKITLKNLEITES